MKRPFPTLLFIALMLLDILAMLAEKQASLKATGDGPALLLGYLSQPWLYIILAFKVAQLFTWTAILSRVDISLAFPLTAIHIPLVMFSATLVFHEQLSISTWLGALLITAGVFVIGPSHTEPQPTL